MHHALSSRWLRIVAIGTIVGLSVGNLGCKKLIRKVAPGADGGGGSGSGSGAAAQADDADTQLEKKIEPYIECLNSISSNVIQMRKYYLTFIPPNGPTGKETSPGMNTLSKGDASKCAAGVAKAKTKPPSNPQLEQAGEAFAQAATRIDKISNELHDYFDKKNFLDDKWAKGKALHPQLMEAFKAFGKADDTLHNVLDGITKPLHQRELARVEKEDGKKFVYHRLHVLNTARDFIDAADDPEIDFSHFTAARTDFQKALADLTAYGDAHKADLKEQKTAPSWPMADTNYDSFIRAANNFDKAQTTFWRCLRDAPAEAKVAGGKVAVEKLKCEKDFFDGTVDRVVLKKYNELISAANSNRFP
ncbi:MAG: YiiG family protein [Polyangiaceae bacterium]|nr:YiiG family protein [Polyangiaceae bacterium]